MKLIAHRGLFTGPNSDIENNPNQIKLALDNGYDAEIDLSIHDNNLFLGHDFPDHIINIEFLETYKEKLWIHAKNLQALNWLLTTNYNYFWHQNDDYVLTSHNYIWSYPGKELTNKCIMLMPEWKSLNFDNLNLNCYGICSDYVSFLK